MSQPQTLTLPATGYGDSAKAFNLAVRRRGHGLDLNGREWLSFGRTWIRFRAAGRERRITWAQFHAGQWS